MLSENLVNHLIDRSQEEIEHSSVEGRHLVEKAWGSANNILALHVRTVNTFLQSSTDTSQGLKAAIIAAKSSGILSKSPRRSYA